MAIEPPVVLAMILGDACEDRHGLHEIIWSLNTRYPTASDTVKLRIAQQALSELATRRFIALYLTADAGRTFESVPEHDIQAAIDAPDSWLPPGDRPAPHYWFGATAAGARAYYSAEGRPRDPA